MFRDDRDQLLLDELTLIREALQSIAKSLVNATEIPEPPPMPDKPIGPEAIGSYAEGINDLEGEDAEAIREQLRAQGLNDRQIEDSLVSFLTGEDNTE